jgi:hypothetical protein
VFGFSSDFNSVISVLSVESAYSLNPLIPVSPWKIPSCALNSVTEMKAIPVLMMLTLCACGGTQVPVPAVPAAGTAAKEDPPFVGRVWMSTKIGNPLGSILLFLPDGTLLMDSCFETYRLSKWGGNEHTIRWLEDTVPIQADVIMPRNNELRLKIAGQDVEHLYVAATVPYVCPDMPR